MGESIQTDPAFAHYTRNAAHYQQDQVTAREATHQYQGRAVPVENSATRTVHEIDGAITVVSVAAKTRQEALNYFKEYKHQAEVEQKRYEKFSLYNIVEIGAGVGIIGAGIGIGVGLSAALLPAIAVVALGTLFTADGVYKKTQNDKIVHSVGSDIHRIEGQQKQWRDPLSDLIEKRKQAGLLGFNYVFQNKFKGSLLHFEEVKKLWIDSFQTLLQDHQNIERVYEEDLLGERAVEYAFEGGIVFGESAQVIPKYRQWRDLFKTLKHDKETALQSLYTQKNAIKQSISSMPTRWLLPAERMKMFGLREAERRSDTHLRPYILEKEHAISEAKKRLSYTIADPTDFQAVAYKQQMDQLLTETIQKIKAQYKCHPMVREIKAAYAHEVRVHQFLYDQSRSLVNGYFDNKEQLLKQESQMAEAQIESHYQRGKEQLKGMLHKICRNELLDYRDWSVPRLVNEWKFSDYSSEPGWNHIYGSRPLFQSQFASTISQDAWDRFWGNRGIGLFASQPVNAWDSMEHDCVPCFGNYPVYLAPHRGLFVQAFEVPVFHRTSFSSPRTNPAPQPARPAPRPQPAAARAERVVPGTKAPEGPRVVPGTRVSVGYGSTTRRSAAPISQPAAPRAERVVPGTKASEGPRVVPGTRVSVGYSSTTRR
jgi:hypothetical protein